VTTLRWNDVTEVPADLGRTVVTLGVFDGVHRGHRLLVDRAVAQAKKIDVPSVVVTFAPHPAAVVRPGTEPPALSTLDHRVQLLSEAGVTAVLVLPFTEQIAKLTPEDFVQSVIVGRLRALEVVVGANFRFGHRAAGDVDTLADIGRGLAPDQRFEVDSVDLLTGGGGVWSSTYVRGLVAAGDVAAAAESLGRLHRVEGVVVHGDARGRELGYPTANLDVVPGTAIPADGIYAGWLLRPNGDRLPAAVSIGTNPTFDGVGRRVEAFVLDVNLPVEQFNLYGEAVALDFVSRLRGTVKFDSIDDLLVQMAADVDETRRQLAH